IITATLQSMNNMGEGIRFYQDEELDYSYVSGCFGIQIKYLDSPDNDELDQRKALLKEIDPDNKICTPGEYIGYMIGDVSGQIGNIRNLILLVVLCINVLVTVLMVKSFITKEKGELEMLKAIGFNNSSLIAWQTIRIGIILLISIILGTLLSTPLSKLTVKPAFKMMGAISIEFEIVPIKVYLLYPLILLVVTVLAAWITSFQLRKISASEVSNIE
ncbi:MAG: FtsX-like permease family protein, partial [Oscillospiraceae bacterium]|nr:FtsX-like permease family protein [Oscillospiraceae bacterium]